MTHKYDPDFDDPPIPPKESYMAELRASLKTTPDNVRLSVCEVVVNGAAFVSAHLAVVERHWGKPSARPYLARLLAYREIICKL
jgi:hypothetical protein